MHRLILITLCLSVLAASCAKDPSNQLRSSLGTGYDQLEEYQFAQADSSFSKLIATNPSDPIGLYGKGLVHERRLEFYDALYQYLLIAKLSPQYSPPYAASARMFRMLGNSELAAEYAKQYIKRGGSAETGYIDLAAILLDNRQFTEAALALKAADSLGIGATWKDLVQARAYALRLQIDSANAAFARAKSGQEETPAWYQMAADYYEAREIDDSAIAASREASEAPGSDQGDLLAHFLRCLKLRHDYEAGQLLEQIKGKAGTDFGAYAAQVQYYSAIGDRFRADQAINKLIRRKDFLYSTLMYEARVRWNLADFQTAFDNLEGMARMAQDKSLSPDFTDFITGVVVLFENEMGDDESVFKRIQSVGGFRTEKLPFRVAQAEMFLRGAGEVQFAQAVQAMETGHPDQPDWMTALGKLHWGKVKRDSINAEKYFGLALDKDPAYAPAMNELIDMLTWRTQFDRAAELFSKYPQFDRSPEMLVRKAYCQVRAGRPDAGTATYLSTMENFSRNISRHEEFYSFLMSRGLTDQAAQIAQQVLKFNPKDPFSFELAARSAGDRGDFQGAIKFADDGLAIDKNSAGLGAQKARALYLSGRKADAVAMFESLLKDSPMDAEVLHYYSRCLASDKSELPLAADLARSAQFVESGSYRATLNLSYVYYQAGAAAESRAEANRVYNSYPYEPEPAYMMARALEQEGKPEARMFYDRARALGLAGAQQETTGQPNGTM